MATHITEPPSKAWAQVADQALAVNGNDTKMRRNYKLPTKNLKNVLSYIQNGTTIHAVHSYLSSICDNVDEGITETEWALPLSANSAWLVDSYTVEEIEAGEYSLLKLVYTILPFNLSDLSAEQTYTISETLTQTMQSYSVSPYIYCNMQSQFKPTLLSAYNDERKPVGLSSTRTHINSFFNQPAIQKGGNLFGYEYQKNKYAILTNAEAQIAEKIMNGNNPVFHYPVVQYSKELMSTKQNPSIVDLPGDVDTIVNPEEDIFESWNGDWIYIGRNGVRTVQKIHETESEQSQVLSAIYKLQYTDTWIGAISADVDFYGPNKWNFGEGPTVEKQY